MSGACGLCLSALQHTRSPSNERLAPVDRRTPHGHAPHHDGVGRAHSRPRRCRRRRNRFRRDAQRLLRVRLRRREAARALRSLARDAGTRAAHGGVRVEERKSGNPAPDRGAAAWAASCVHSQTDRYRLLLTIPSSPCHRTHTPFMGMATASTCVPYPEEWVRDADHHRWRPRIWQGYAVRVHRRGTWPSQRETQISHLHRGVSLPSQRTLPLFAIPKRSASTTTTPPNPRPTSEVLSGSDSPSYP